MTYDFKEQLQKSEAPALEEGWLVAYRGYFGEVKSLTKMDSLYVQRQGFDRVLVDGYGRAWNIEEKADFYDNDRIALEYVSNTTTGALGWVTKPTNAHYVAYRKVLNGQVWLWSVPNVQRAWSQHGPRLIEAAKSRQLGFVHGEARNEGYSSLCACVPIQYWQRALRTSTEVKL